MHAGRQVDRGPRLAPDVGPLDRASGLARGVRRVTVPDGPIVDDHRARQPARHDLALAIRRGRPQGRLEWRAGTKRVAPLSLRNSSTMKMNPTIGHPSASPSKSTWRSWAREPGRRVRPSIVPSSDRPADDETARREDGPVDIQPVEFRAAIHEVVDPGRRAADRDIPRVRRRHGGVVGPGQPRQPVGRHRAGDDNEAHLFQVPVVRSTSSGPGAIPPNQSSVCIRLLSTIPRETDPQPESRAPP